MASNDEYQQREFWETTDTDPEILKCVLEFREKNKQILNDKFNEILVFGSTEIRYDSTANKLT